MELVLFLVLSSVAVAVFLSAKREAVGVTGILDDHSLVAYLVLPILPY
jgi:hypothetical protein